MQLTNNLNKNFSNFKYSRFNPSVNEWINSTYSFEKRNANFINNKLSYTLVNSYFNTRPFFLGKTNIKGKNLYDKKSFLSLDRIFVSMPEFKQSIQSLSIFLYVFNKKEVLLLNKINKLKSLGYTNNFITKKSAEITNAQSNDVTSKVCIDNMYILLKSNLKLRYYKVFLYKNYLAKLYFNRFIFNLNNLFYLKKILHGIYNTEVSINIINLKYLYLDNNLFVDAISRKLKNRKRKVLRVLRRALILPKIPLIDHLLLINKKIFLNNYNNLINNKSKLIAFGQLKGLKSIRNSIYETIKNIHVVGIRLEGKGRLTRRLTASRAVFKVTYLGCLKNIYSSFQGLSSVVNKGFEKSNISYTNINSNNRNGAFGIKSWQNTM